MRRNRFREAHGPTVLWDLYGISAELEQSYSGLLGDLARGLDRIDPRHALVLRLRYGLGKDGVPQSYPQIAKILDIGDGQARDRVALALAALRKQDAEIRRWGVKFAGWKP